ncbi:MAG: type II secretion system F family protein [Lachnospiraceae bacterium]
MREQWISKLPRQRKIINAHQVLYIGTEMNEKLDAYYKKKWTCFIIITCLGLLFLLIFLIETITTKQEIKEFERNEYGGGKQEIQLEVQDELGKWNNYLLEIEERVYTKEEIEQLFTELEFELEQLIKNKNNSLSNVNTDLSLIDSYKEYPIEITWESSNTEYISRNGRINTEKITEPKMITLYATASYYDFEKIIEIHCIIYPKEKTYTEEFLHKIKQLVMEESEKSKSSSIVKLPNKINDFVLNWKTKNSLDLFYGSLLIFILAFASFWLFDRELFKELKARESELEKEYPNFLSTIVLLLGTGMSMSNIFIRMSKEYKEKKEKGKKTNYLYEELIFLENQIKNGKNSIEVYELFSRRCNISCYRKLSLLLVQNEHKGSYGLLQSLRIEVIHAFMERKMRAKRKGEEISTKLLGPMVMLLGLVMIIIMIPAYLSFI